MNFALYGTQLDIHGGGDDLIFPHHENEIAQSEAFTKNTFANYWMHNGMIMVNGKKMSKSEGNFITIKEALQENTGNAIRLFVTEHSLQNAPKLYKRGYYSSSKWDK